MGTFSITIDTSMFMQDHQQLFSQLANAEISVRPIAVEMVGLMHKRVHTEGRASDGSKIGTYSSNYLRMRKRAGLGPGRDVIAVLTRKTSNSWTAFKTAKGYAVGFIDQKASGLTALQKMKYIEENFGKSILQLSPDEVKYSYERLIEIATGLINKLKQKK